MIAADLRANRPKKEKKSDQGKKIVKTREDSGKDPRKFWSTIKASTSNKSVQNTIATEEWFNHFHQVFNDDSGLGS